MNELVLAAWSMTETFGARLAGVSAPLLLAGLALHTLKLGARARVWQNVLRASLPETRVGFRDAAVPYLAGIGAGVIVPFGGGEVLRVALARTRLRGRDSSVSTATIAGSLGVERVLDVAISAVVIVFALTAGLLPNGVLGGRLAALLHPTVLGLVGAGILLIAVAAWRYRHRLAANARAVLRGLVVLRQPRRYLICVATWQLLAWILRFGSLVLFLDAFHVPSALLVAPVVLSLQLLAGSVPVTPAGAGTQQALVAAAFGSGALFAFSAGAQLATTVVDLLLALAAVASWRMWPQLRQLRPAALPA
jgi:uncharacterized membrane protein YbhN (UPF0104 family)